MTSTKKFKVGIVGSREWQSYRDIKDFVFFLKNKYKDDLVIVSGGQPLGADGMAKKAALDLNVEYIEFPPYHFEYNQYCQGNGIPRYMYNKPYHVRYFFMRNAQIAEFSDFIVAFIPKGKKSNGTMDTVKKAEKLGKKVLIQKK